MTRAQHTLVTQWRAVFCPAPAVKAHREATAFAVVAHIAGAVIPWMLAASFVWMIGAWMTRWNVGL